ncbi:hypothetical protein OBBRIDRAFT_241511 [Obba rivulosa]|uniref:Uncharacterized protein n=1 Tax=Obba rivulosa TaxID=1052685 RepID=A0A8E2AR28_9APHY|nr:hypothetical protein OBBRIDRAFT_241511 [Obba rivulosa]
MCSGGIGSASHQWRVLVMLHVVARPKISHTAPILINCAEKLSTRHPQTTYDRLMQCSEIDSVLPRRLVQQKANQRRYMSMKRREERKKTKGLEPEATAKPGDAVQGTRRDLQRWLARLLLALGSCTRSDLGARGLHSHGALAHPLRSKPPARTLLLDDNRVLHPVAVNLEIRHRCWTWASRALL